MEKIIAETRDLVGRHWPAIEALAVKLVEKNIIQGEEAIDIIKTAEAAFFSWLAKKLG